MSAES